MIQQIAQTDNVEEFLSTFKTVTFIALADSLNSLSKNGVEKKGAMVNILNLAKIIELAQPGDNFVESIIKYSDSNTAGYLTPDSHVNDFSVAEIKETIYSAAYVMQTYHPEKHAQAAKFLEQMENDESLIEHLKQKLEESHSPGVYPLRPR